MGNPSKAADYDQKILNRIFGSLAGVPAILGYIIFLFRRLGAPIENIDGLTSVGVVLGVMGILFITCLFGSNGYQPLGTYRKKVRLWCAGGLVVFSLSTFFGVYLLLFRSLVPVWLAVPVSAFYYVAGFYLCAVGFSSIHASPTEKSRKP